MLLLDGVLLFIMSFWKLLICVLFLCLVVLVVSQQDVLPGLIESMNKELNMEEQKEMRWNEEEKVKKPFAKPVDDFVPRNPHMSRLWDDLYVGNQHAALSFNDVSNVEKFDLRGILNVAFDLDIEFASDIYKGTVAGSNRRMIFRYNKVGLVDGEGNFVETLLSALYTLHQMLEKTKMLKKDQETFDEQRKAVLVHCQVMRVRWSLFLSNSSFFSLAWSK